jgi:multiple sugar transport system substrate-binding protein
MTHRNRKMPTAAFLMAVATMTAGLATTSEATASILAPKSLSGTTINEWATAEGADGAATSLATLRPLAAQFKKQTGITVNIQVIPWSILLTKLTAVIAGGTGPDIAEVGCTWSGQLAASGGFVPWPTSAFNQIGGEAKFIPSVIGATGDPGQPPIDLMEFAESYAMYYNTALFKQAGIASPPRTWSQFVADAQKLTNPAKGIWGVAADTANIAAEEKWNWIISQQFGGRYYSSPSKDVATVNSPGVAKAITMMLDWMGPDHIMAPGDAEFNNNQAETAFAHGKAAMVFTQGDSIFTADGMKASDFAPALIPMASINPPAGDAVMSHLDGVNIGIFKTTKHLAADYAWLNFLTNKGPQTTIAQSYGVVPATKLAAASPVFQNNAQDKVFLQIQSKYAEPMPTQSDSGTLEEAVSRSVGQLFDNVATSGKVSLAQVESALDDVNSSALAREQS